jgi:predicted XRE-type DNA-binding protein
MTEELSFTNGFEAITTDPQEATELATRSDLILILHKIIKHHHWTAKEAADQLNTTEAVVGELLKGKIQKFSLSQLLGFLGHLGFTFKYTYEANDPQMPLKVAVMKTAKASRN